MHFDHRKTPNTLSRLQDVLDRTMRWPNVYVFKFIVPQASVNHLLALLDGLPITTRDSSSGRYVGVTSEAMMESPAAVIAVYERVADVDGLMSL